MLSVIPSLMSPYIEAIWPFLSPFSQFIPYTGNTQYQRTADTECIFIVTYGVWPYFCNVATILNIIHRPVLYLKHDVSCRYFKQKDVNKIYMFIRTSQKT
jgi:hypothetical protein